MDDIDAIFIIGMAAMMVIGGVLLVDLHCALQHEEDYDLGSVVTTTAEYEYLTNDTFTGVVVRGETLDDPARTLRNRDGVERRIATEFLEPMR